jgi:hypothetical protein
MSANFCVCLLYAQLHYSIEKEFFCEQSTLSEVDPMDE